MSETTSSLSKSDADQEFAEMWGQSSLSSLLSLLSHFLFPPSRPSLSLSLSLLSPLSSTSPIHTFSQPALSLPLSSLLSPLSSLFPPSRPLSSPLLSPLSLSSLSLSMGSHRPLSLLPSLSSLTKFPQNFSKTAQPTHPITGEIGPSAASSIQRPPTSFLSYKKPSSPPHSSPPPEIRRSASKTAPPYSDQQPLLLLLPPANSSSHRPSFNILLFPPTATSRRQPPLGPNPISPQKNTPFLSPPKTPFLSPPKTLSLSTRERNPSFPANSTENPGEPHKPRRTSIVRYVYLPGLTHLCGG